MSGELGWSAVAAVVMVVGLCGVVIPVLPGLALIWLTALIYGFAVGYDTLGVAVMIVLTALLLAGMVKSVLIPRRTSIESGASAWSQLGGVVGAIAGFFLIPVLGVIIGALLGVLAVEFVIKGNWTEAWAATKGLARGFGLSAVIDLGLGLMMMTVWAVWAATVVL